MAATGWAVVAGRRRVHHLEAVRRAAAAHPPVVGGQPRVPCACATHWLHDDEKPDARQNVDLSPEIDAANSRGSMRHITLIT